MREGATGLLGGLERGVEARKLGWGGVRSGNLRWGLEFWAGVGWASIFHSPVEEYPPPCRLNPGEGSRFCRTNGRCAREKSEPTPEL